jgi:hypothetical protein
MGEDRTMDYETIAEDMIVEALVRELDEQGQGGTAKTDPTRLRAYPIKGTIDVLALAEAVENALRGGAQSDDGKAPAELNAANDG